MKKSLIALAVAGVVSAPAFAATSNVDVYGVLDAAVNHIDVDVNGTGSKGWTVGENTGNSGSRLGFKGSEDLGGGLKAVWQIESVVSVDAESSIGKRNTFVGLGGGFGTVLVGRHDTPEKISTGSLDMFADNTGDYNSNLAIVDTREQNVIAYISPSMSGLTIAAAAVAGEFTNAGDNDGLLDHYSIAAMYSNGPLYLSAAYTSLSEGYNLGTLAVFGQNVAAVGATTDDHDIFRLGVGYTMGDLKLAAVYQDIDGDNVDGSGFTVGASYAMGPMVLKAQYNNREDLLEGWTIGADYNLSKRTKAYVAYTTQSEEDGGDIDVDVFTVGMRHSF